ncbi:MAG: flavodoxin family protein [Syntrophomonadaceae bacterium]|nr:flavodoxin family protein [Syntrophomonadaceae bacterium]
MKKVLGLVVSNRKLGNSEVLVKEIMSNIPEECDRELIRLTDLDIKPCKACYVCLQPEKACPVQDDFNFVIEKIRKADALIIGVPVYFLGPHGYFKMLTDRLVGAQNHAQATRGKPCIIVMPYGSTGWEGYSKAAAIVMPNLLRMKLVDCWQIFATLPGESLLNHDNISYARSLGRELFSGREYQAGSKECPVCGSDLFRLLNENQVECPICGSRGVLRNNGSHEFSIPDHHRFSDQEMDIHFKGWLLEMKDRFLDQKDHLKELQRGYRDMNWWVKP